MLTAIGLTASSAAAVGSKLWVGVFVITPLLIAFSILMDRWTFVFARESRKGLRRYSVPPQDAKFNVKIAYGIYRAMPAGTVLVSLGSLWFAVDSIGKYASLDVSAIRTALGVLLFTWLVIACGPAMLFNKPSFLILPGMHSESGLLNWPIA
jgi:hypothetical protein